MNRAGGAGGAALPPPPTFREEIFQYVSVLTAEYREGREIGIKFTNLHVIAAEALEVPVIVRCIQAELFKEMSHGVC